ncbi:Prenyltransferase and squalene oxidase repeat family protein [Babesia bovis T2Bo]|uniref:Prenyltransferase and squalene oxidase repeat family protein n=1 Tax=Babesia bovis TaxID=5865 RepID=A7AN84_BABBO|nr:Prenyltransferase and squalene oxidase repeat family protein [Babesia bovis T2Bo]EDO08018.1 Prenyltransferase and squalene oxidase repeat family protein [Babesia bovis T2Bo]|eukprot:XP_001611586.1 prenyltransferase and squalene oxidase repeat family protein [Babesia bovis T2Bo]
MTLEVQERIIRRIKGAITRLEACCSGVDSPDVGIDNDTGDSTAMSTNDIRDGLSRSAGDVLACYMVNVCKGCDFDEADGLNGSTNASIQAQSLVERDCVAIYSATLSRYLKLEYLGDNIVESPKYDGADCFSISIGDLSRCFPIRNALSILSDFCISDGVLRIDLRKHPFNFLRRIGNILCQMCPLSRDSHIHYIAKHLTVSGAAKVVQLDNFTCSQPWVVYWSLHGLSILGADISLYKDRAIHSLFSCWDSVSGGFGGGPGQIGHLATTYAAICCFKMFGCVNMLDTAKIRKFLFDMKQPDGTFTVHRGGEVDVRGIYCAVASAFLLDILDPELSEGVAARIAMCQGYDGGIGGEPFLESHAGYVYCGTAALKLLNSLDAIDTDRLLQWCRQRQTAELGFQGRPHKLVDVCYSFWLSGTLALLNEPINSSSDLSHLLLKAYILCISQNPGGGFRDKPTKPVDLYHTCYALSAMEVISQPPHLSRLDIALNILKC